MSSIEELKRMKTLGFKLLGDIFKDTLAYVQIERRIKEFEEGKEQETKTMKNVQRTLLDKDSSPANS